MRYLVEQASGKRVLLFLGITLAVYVLMLFITIPRLLGYSGGVQIPDLMPGGYGPEHIGMLLEILGQEGRDYYLFRQIPLDLFYPALFAYTNVLLLVYLLSKLGGRALRFVPVVIVPVVAGLFDYAENIMVIRLLLGFPNIPAHLVNVASLFTVLKSVFTILFFVFLFSAALLLLLRWMGKIGSGPAVN